MGRHSSWKRKISLKFSPNGENCCIQDFVVQPNHIGSSSKILQHPGTTIERGGFWFVSRLRKSCRGITCSLDVWSCYHFNHCCATKSLVQRFSCSDQLGTKVHMALTSQNIWSRNSSEDKLWLHGPEVKLRVSQQSAAATDFVKVKRERINW